MVVRRPAAGHLVIAAGLVTMLAGCAATPLGPTVQAMPGPGKSFDAFQTDNTTCKGFATDQVRGQADASNQRTAGAVMLGTVLGAGFGAAVGGSVGDAGSGAAIGAATGAGTGTAIGAGNGANDQAMIQQQYDNAFSQCMFAKGEQVPGFAPAVAYGPGPAADPLVRASQAELIRLGYLHGGADGYIGPRTRAAISGFEQAHALPVDGAPSAPLLARLQSTPTGATAIPATATASAPGNWVAPAGSASATPTASSSSNWVAPAGSPSATPASASAPAAPAPAWVTPSK